MNFLKKISFLLIIATGLSALTSCNNSGENKKEEKPDQKPEISKEGVTIYYSNWAETIAMTKVTKLALEEAGIEIETYLLGPGAMYASLAKGEGDIFLESWLPQTHAEYWEKYGGKLDKVSTSFDNASTGLVVPQYVDINSIEELNANKEKFDGKIIGIGSGAGIHKDTEKAIEEYGLDYKQITSSGPAMVTSLKKAIMKKEPIVITGWKPHFKWAKFDLKYLKDPKNVYPKEKAWIVTRKNFTQERPGFKTFLENFHLTDMQVADLMLTFENMEDDEKAAKKWYNENKEMIRSWMPEAWKE